MFRQSNFVALVLLVICLFGLSLAPSITATPSDQHVTYGDAMAACHAWGHAGWPIFLHADEHARTAALFYGFIEGHCWPDEFFHVCTEDAFWIAHLDGEFRDETVYNLKEWIEEYNQIWHVEINIRKWGWPEWKPISDFGTIIQTYGIENDNIHGQFYWVFTGAVFRPRQFSPGFYLIKTDLYEYGNIHFTLYGLFIVEECECFT